MDSYVTSVIRTVVPVIVGSIGAFLASKGINVDPTALAGLTAFLAGLFSAIYYIAVRFLEDRFPKFGWLLGRPGTPLY